MACKCVRCEECNGSGDVWYSFDGEYRGRYHSDDLDELGVCLDCDGEGVIEMCDECRMAFEDEEVGDE